MPALNSPVFFLHDLTKKKGTNKSRGRKPRAALWSSFVLVTVDTIHLAAAIECSLANIFLLKYKRYNSDSLAGEFHPHFWGTIKCGGDSGPRSFLCF
jgi:hypothetical protein